MLADLLATRAPGESKERYDQAIARRLVDMALHAAEDKDALAAAQFIWERMEGKVPQPISGASEGGEIRVELVSYKA